MPQEPRESPRTRTVSVQWTWWWPIRWARSTPATVSAAVPTMRPSTAKALIRPVIPATIMPVTDGTARAWAMP
jgi:hypothetical protein